MTIKRIILDYEAGELTMQVRAAHEAIRAGRPSDGLSSLSFGRGAERLFFAVKWNKDSVRVYPQDRR